MLEDRIKVGQVDRLDRFHAVELDCGRALLETPGVHVIPSERRGRPGWGGYTVPLLGLSTGGGGIVSVRPDLVDRVRAALAPASVGRPLGAADFDHVRQAARAAIPYAYNLSGYVLFADPDHYRPQPSRAEQIRQGDPSGADIRRRFDGEVFGIRNTRRKIVSWAAIKLKSDQVWEIAVVTDAPYRGQGLAKEVVSAATGYILEQGRLALYVHDRTNTASAAVCRSLGYVEYGEEFFSEY